MSQRITPAGEVLCAMCAQHAWESEPTCLCCDAPFERLRIRNSLDLERIAPAVRRIDSDYGRDRVYAEEVLTKLTLRAIADGALCPEQMAAALLIILDEKANRLYA